MAYGPVNYVLKKVKGLQPELGVWPRRKISSFGRCVVRVLWNSGWWQLSSSYHHTQSVIDVGLFYFILRNCRRSCHACIHRCHISLHGIYESRWMMHH